MSDFDANNAVAGGGPSDTVDSNGAAVAGATDPRYQHDRFVVIQKLRPLVNKYEVHSAADAGKKPKPGAFVAYVQEKRVSLRGMIKFYADDTKQQEILALNGDKKVTIRGTYTLRDELTGATIGSIKRRLGASVFFKSTWDVYDPAGRVIASATESSTLLAIVRRYVSDIANFFPYAFTITAGADAQAYGVNPGVEIGRYVRRWGLRDIYDYDLTADQGKLLDRRLAVALAIALDAFQGR